MRDARPSKRVIISSYSDDGTWIVNPFVISDNTFAIFLDAPRRRGWKAKNMDVIHSAEERRRGDAKSYETSCLSQLRASRRRTASMLRNAAKEN